jgi:hypothetical protein
MSLVAVRKLYLVFALVTVMNVGALHGALVVKLRDNAGGGISMHTPGGNLNLTALLADGPFTGLGAGFSLFGVPDSGDGYFGGKKGASNDGTRFVGSAGTFTVLNNGWNATGPLNTTGPNGVSLRGTFIGVIAFGVSGMGEVLVPASFLGGPTNHVDPSSVQFFGQTLASNGLSGGETLTFSWGTGLDADFIEFQAVPEPSTYAMLFGFSMLGLIAVRRFKKAKA